MKDSLIERAVLKIAKSRHIEQFAIRALLKANELLGLAIGVRLAKLRDSEDRFAALLAESEAHALQARLHAEISGIVASRWDRLPERRRPHYRPSERYRILRIRQLLSLSHEETARMFRISSETVARWEQEVDRKPEGDKIGSLVRPQPPVRRYADVVRHLVKSMALAGFGGYETIAQTLARAGWKLSKRTIARILKEKAPTPLQDLDILPTPRAVRARYPNHIWMSDITEIPNLFGLFCFHLAVVLDVFSRFPLASFAQSRAQPNWPGSPSTPFSVSGLPNTSSPTKVASLLRRIFKDGCGAMVFCIASVLSERLALSPSLRGFGGPSSDAYL